jgi:hypothetical protein
MFKRSLGTITVLAGLLAAAAPAHAGTLVGNPGKGSAVIESIGTKYTMLEPGRLLPEVDDEVLL